MLLLFAATYDVLGTFPSAVSRMKLQLQLLTHVLQFFSLRYPITAKTSSNWMVLFANASYLNNCELEIASIARQTRRVEQSSDRQVALNCHCEGHFVFFYKSTICLRISNIVINLVYIHTFFLNPLVFFFQISLSRNRSKVQS